jgi:hypothetical protein
MEPLSGHGRFGLVLKGMDELTWRKDRVRKQAAEEQRKKEEARRGERSDSERVQERVESHSGVASEHTGIEPKLPDDIA